MLTALVTMQRTDCLGGLRFIDCVATLVEEADPPNGYGKRPPEPDKYGHVNPYYSEVSGLIGGATKCTVYLAQFKIPCEWGEHVSFFARPSDFMEACVRALKEERCPPEYVI